MTLPDLPIDTKASRLHRDRGMTDDVFDSLREYERLARTADQGYTITSAFTADAVTWIPVWLAPEPPAAVRTIVVRDGVTTEEYRSWAEARPSDEEGRERWDGNPATLLRAFTERAALRRAFADVIVGRDRPQGSAVEAFGSMDAAVARFKAATAGGVVAAVMSPPEPAQDRIIPPGWLKTLTEEKAPGPRPVARPRPEEPEVRIPRRRTPKPPTAIEQALHDAELASGKTVTRKSSSRAQRDSGKRRGGRS